MAQETTQSTTTSAIKYGVLAAGLGYVAGLLFAPKSGREMRSDVRQKALLVRDTASDTFIKGKEKARQLITQTADQAKEIAQTELQPTAGQRADPVRSHTAM